MTSNDQNLIRKPLHIEIALYFTNPQRPETAPWVGQDIDSVAKVFRDFTESGLLELSDEDGLWKATDAMYRYVENLYRVSLPGNQAVKAQEGVSQSRSLLEKGKKSFGENTMKFKALNSIITAAIAEHMASTPKART